MLILWAYVKDRKYYGDKAKTVDPKVNRGPHSQPTASQQTVWKIHLHPQYILEV